MNLGTISVAWNRFLFSPVSAEPVAVFRVLLGLWLIANGLILWPLRFDFFSDAGVIRMETVAKLLHSSSFTIFNWIPSTSTWVTGVLAAYLLTAVAFTLGLFTRVSTLILWVLFVSLHHRNLYILNGGDTLARTLLFLMLFCPSGRLYSLDRYFQRRNRHQKRLSSNDQIPAWPLRLLQIQFVLVYLIGTLEKLGGSQWIDGTATYYALSLEEFQRFPLPEFLRSVALQKFLTWSTLFIEGMAPVFLWIRELRYPMMLALIALHLGIEATMNVPLFEWIMILSLILFCNPKDIRRFIGNLRSRFSST